MDNKYTLIMGQLLQLALDLEAYFKAKISSPPKEEVIKPTCISIFAAMAIDLHMVGIQVQVGKNIVDDILLDGSSCMNIIREELHCKLGLS
jgi:hypothetical protein